jgi:hypothetical protein
MHAVKGGQRGRKRSELFNVNEWVWTKKLKTRGEGENSADVTSSISYERFSGEPYKCKLQNKTQALTVYAKIPVIVEDKGYIERALVVVIRRASTNYVAFGPIGIEW